MSRSKFLPGIALFCCTTIVMSVSGFPLLILPEAYAREQSNLIAKIKRFFVGTRPRGVASGRQRGGARRDRCPNVSTPLTALVPFDLDGFPFVEQTISERPKFWFYIPYLPISRRNAEFVLIDENEDDVYSATFPLTQQAGIVSLQLPATVPLLKEGKKYRWVFSVICNPLNRSGDATVNGWIERVPESSTLNTQIMAASLREQISIYAEAGLWYEAWAAFANLQKNNPQDEDLNSDWISLQKTFGLTDTSSQRWTIYFLPEPGWD